MKQSYEEKSLLSLISSLNNLMEIQGIPGLLSAVGDYKTKINYGYRNINSAPKRRSL